jgi:hypothetical protein
VVHTQFKGKHFPLLHSLPKLGAKTLVYKTCPQLFPKRVGSKYQGEPDNNVTQLFSLEIPRSANGRHQKFHTPFLKEKLNSQSPLKMEPFKGS